MTNGKARVRADMAKAKAFKAVKGAAPAKPPAYLLERFEDCPEGLFRKKFEEKPRLWICSRFKVTAAARDGEHGAWSLVMEWYDPDGFLHNDQIVPRAMLVGDGGEARTLFAAGGLLMNTRQEARQALLEYLNAVETTERAHIVSRSGWADICGAATFVLPSGAIGKTRERVILHAVTREPSNFNKSGTLSDWQSLVALSAIGNSRILLALSYAFVGPLLELLGEDGGGIHFRGPAKIAKTLALVMATSVWGGSPGAGAKGMVMNWRSTANAMEGVAVLLSDTFLALDELNQVDGRDCGDVIYMIGNGRTKMRSDRAGALRAPLRFRLPFLSSGEISLAAKMAEGGKTLRAGQEVRCIDLQADAGTGFGIFDTLGDEATSVETLAQSLYSATRTCYGTAGPAFLARLVDDVRRDPQFIDRLSAQIENLLGQWLAAYEAISGQVRTVAKRFALIAVAGELASSYHVTGWGRGVATAGVRACFDAWLTDRATVASREDIQAIVQLRNFIARFSGSRFELWPDRKRNEALQGDDGEAPPEPRWRPGDRAGWRRWDAKTQRFIIYVLPVAMKDEVLSGLEYDMAIKLLSEKGYFVKDKAGKSQVSIAVPGKGQTRLFQMSNTIEDEASEQPQAQNLMDEDDTWH